MMDYEVSVVIPCLNEAETLEIVIKKAQKCLEENQIAGEVLIADNGSTDGSQDIARRCGARVVDVPARGYGAALIGGINAALGKYCIMGDADDSYDFSDLMPYILKLREGYDLVMGNRFRGGIEKGAMPFLHRYLGTPVISFLGRLFYHNKIGDFNCGMRGYNRERIQELNLRATGMEYASEMIIQAALHDYKIAEVPTTLSVDGRSRKPYLNTWSDGWRHLKVLLLHTPDWLFFYPGCLLAAVGLILMIMLIGGPVQISHISLDINTMLFAGAFLIIGVNAILFSVYTKIYAAKTFYIPMNKSIEKISRFSADQGIGIGFLLFVTGLIIAIVACIIWGSTSFGDLNPQKVMHITIPAVTLCSIGAELIFGGFFIGILNIKHE
ncbi:MAG: glycosyltransferase family 2 protein [Lachnospiraceae bacterium]